MNRMMTQEERKAWYEANNPSTEPYEPDYQYIPRLTKSSFVYFKGKRAGEWKDQAEERKVRQFVLKHLGGFDLVRRYNTEEEKRRMVEFLNSTKYDFAIAVVVRILLEARGCFEELADKRRIDNLVAKCRRWQKAYKLDPINGLKDKRIGKPSSIRKINLELVREAILAIGSSAPRKGYKAYYDYYMERERETRPDFKHGYNNFIKWCDRIIKGDKKIQSVLLTQYLRKDQIFKAINQGTRLTW